MSNRFRVLLIEDCLRDAVLNWRRLDIARGADIGTIDVQLDR